MMPTLPNTSPKWFHLVYFLLALTLVLSQPASANDGELHWAIMSDTATREMGFSDLLAAELASSGFSMIERDQIRQLEDEMLRDFSSTNTSLKQHFDLCKRVGANRLILCQQQFKATPKTLRVVVCDVDIAARIGVFEFSILPPPKLAKNTAQFLKSLDAQFQSGVEQVVGLMPFSCKNLEPDFAELGPTSYALLAAQILSVPRVGLMEWESAKELTKELVSFDRITKRQVPIMIEVDYRVILSQQKRPSSIALALRILNGKEPKNFSATVPFAEMNQWLRKHILPIVLDQQQTNQGISKSDQLRMLKERASHLFRLGDLVQCTQVREVVLQISPGDDEERQRLLDDYGLFVKPLEERTWKLFPLTLSEIQSRSSCQDHFEYLVRNRRISFVDAIRRFGILALAPEFKWALNGITPKYSLSSMDLQRTLAVFDKDDQFVRAVGPSILKLDRPVEFSQDDELRARLNWTNAVLNSARLRAWFHSGTEGSREDAAKLIEDVVPEDFPTISTGAWLFGVSTFPKQTILTTNLTGIRAEQKRFEVGIWPEDALVFTTSLTGASHRHLRLYGRLGEFSFHHADRLDLYDPYTKKPIGDTASLELLMPELDQLIELAKQTTCAEKTGLTGPNQKTFDCVLNVSLVYRRELKRRIAGTPLPTYADFPTTEPGFGRLSLEETTIEPPELDNYYCGWIGDGPDHDLVYDKTRVYRLDRQGVFTLISPESGYDFFDEQFVWKTQKHSIGGCSLTVLDRDGKAVLLDEVLDLPPCDSWTAFAAGKLRNIFIGTISKSSTSWCAIVELKEGRTESRVFHEAREPYKLNSPQEIQRANESIYSQIIPTWHVYGVDQTGEILLVGRSQLYPLRIDLSSLKVSVMTLQGPPPVSDSLIAGQRLYLSQSNVVDEFDLHNSEREIVPRRVVGMDHMEQMRKGHATAGNNRGRMLLDNGWLLFPGETWYRYHLQSKQTERLVPTRLPRPYSQYLSGVSSIHGLILWNPKSEPTVTKGSLYRVKILSAE